MNILHYKNKNRKNKVQLIDVKNFYKFIRNKLGEKNKEISDEQRLEIMKIYKDFNENENCKIYNNEYFKYTKVQDGPQLLLQVIFA